MKHIIKNLAILISFTITIPTLLGFEELNTDIYQENTEYEMSKEITENVDHIHNKKNKNVQKEYEELLKEKPVERFSQKNDNSNNLSSNITPSGTITLKELKISKILNKKNIKKNYIKGINPYHIK